jgi:hypothetical protein
MTQRQGWTSSWTKWLTASPVLAYCVLLSGCIKPYNAHIQSPGTGYLVVAGNLNAAPASTVINLSRTVAVSDTATTVYENGATVAVECTDGTTYTSAFASGGNYNFGVLALDSTKKYRLDIHTSDGSQYLSQYVAVVPCPPIDSIHIAYDGSGGHVQVNTHNPQGNSRNYMWNYEETWEYHAAEYSTYVFKPDSGIVPRYPAEQVYTCWDSGASTNILIYSTAKLSSDIVNGFQLELIPEGDWRLSVEYSILVNQFALSDSAYYYFQTMQTNTENLGSIFDPLPSNPPGNIYCVNDPSQTVVGYVNASGTQQLRFFTAEPTAWPYRFTCDEKDSVFKFPPSVYQSVYGAQDGAGPYTIITMNPGLPVGWISNLTGCVNCKMQGGFTTKPSYMPN